MDISGEAASLPTRPQLMSECVRLGLIREVAPGCGQIRLCWRCTAESGGDQTEMLSLNLIVALNCTHDRLEKSEREVRDCRTAETREQTGQ